MSHQERHNFYRGVHKGIRAMLFDLMAVAGRTDFTNASELETLRTTAHAAVELLDGHAHHENEFVGPVLEEFLPELATLIDDAHDDQDARLAAILDDLGRLDSAMPGVAANGHSVVVAISRIAGEILVHMADEEELIMSSLWKVLDDATLIGIEQRLVASIPPEKAARLLVWILPYGNDPERVAMFEGIRASAPPEAFAHMWALAESVLSEEDWGALRERLESVAA